MTQTRRLTGGLIDRRKPLNFEFDGRKYSGYQGDTLASALLANGGQLMGRSFKYHRPRGPFTSGSEEPNAIVELREGARKEPNTRATTIELYDDLIAKSQNRWPSLGFDIMAVNDLFSNLCLSTITHFFDNKSLKKNFEVSMRWDPKSPRTPLP